MILSAHGFCSVINDLSSGACWGKEEKGKTDAVLSTTTSSGASGRYLVLSLTIL